MKERGKRHTWRKGKTREGRMRLRPTFSLHCGSDQWIVVVSEHPSGGWYWYGQGQNTADRGTTLDDAKAQALAWVKARGTSASQ